MPSTRLVATLVANPARPVLTDALIDAAARALGQETEQRVLARGIAADISSRRRQRDGRNRHSRRPAATNPSTSSSSRPRPPQAPVPGRHGFHHDRPGMHRRARRLRRPEGGGLGDHRTRHARRDRLRAGAARARGASEGPARRGRRRDHQDPHHPDARRAGTGPDHAGERRLCVPRLGRLHPLHGTDRRRPSASTSTARTASRWRKGA